jgi:hypothetical protein
MGIMKALIIILFTLFSLISLAQDTLTAPGKAPDFKVQVGLHIGAGLIGSISAKGEAKPSIGVETGVDLKINFTRYIGLETGWHYVMMSHNYGPGNETLHRNKFHSFSIPAKVIYTFGEKRLKYNVGGGLSADILLHTSYVDEELPYEYNTLTASAHFQAGLDYKLNRSCNLLITPFFHINMFTIRSGFNNNAHQRLFATGISIGLRFGNRS